MIESLLADFPHQSDADYRIWVKILSLPEEVRGYRGVRAPKMAAARRRADELLQGRETAPDPALLQIGRTSAVST